MGEAVRVLLDAAAEGEVAGAGLEQAERASETTRARGRMRLSMSPLWPEGERPAMRVLPYVPREALGMI